MKITSTMDLHQLLERMGEASLEEAAAMRALLVEKYDGQDTRDIPEDEWLAALERAISKKKFAFTTREYDRIAGEFKDAVTTGYDQEVEAIGLEEAKADYIHWLASQGYFEDCGIPEGREEEAVLGFEVQP